jgi:hypothetical protein
MEATIPPSLHAHGVGMPVETGPFLIRARRSQLLVATPVGQARDAPSTLATT